MPRPPNFPLPEFFHGFRGLQGDFRGFQKIRGLRIKEAAGMARPAGRMGRSLTVWRNAFGKGDFFSI
jgi:hypothetical protein